MLRLVAEIIHHHNERNVSILSTRLYRLIPKQEIQRDVLIFHPTCEDLVKGLPPSRNAVDGMHCGGLLSGGEKKKKILNSVAKIVAKNIVAALLVRAPPAYRAGLLPLVQGIRDPPCLV